MVVANEYRDIMMHIASNLEHLLLGKSPTMLEDACDVPELNHIIELVNMLTSNFGEMEKFARGLAKGNMDVPIPNRRNYLAAPLKELHSQLSSFIWIADQLQKGQVVDRLDYVGELSGALNSLIDQVVNQVGTSSDQPQQKQSESVSSWKYHQMLLTFNHLHQMVLVVGSDGKVLLANRPANDYFGHLKHLRESDLDASSPILKQKLVQANSDQNTFPTYQEVCDDNGSAWYKITSDQILFPDSSTIYLHTIEDISEWKNNETELKISATTDALTNVFNRKIGLSALESAIADKEYTTSCAGFIDIDDLKIINDSFGHNEGDYAIKTIAELLSSSVRDTDTVSRFGGDEFLVVFSGCNVEAAKRVIARVHEKINVINESRIKPYTLSFSYGITQIDENCSSNVKELIMLMDKKMYERKKAKKAKRA